MCLTSRDRQKLKYTVNRLKCLVTMISLENISIIMKMQPATATEIYSPKLHRNWMHCIQALYSSLEYAVFKPWIWLLHFVGIELKMLTLKDLTTAILQKIYNYNTTVTFCLTGRSLFPDHSRLGRTPRDSQRTFVYRWCYKPPRAGSGVVRMDPLRFLAGRRTRRLNQA